MFGTSEAFVRITLMRTNYIDLVEQLVGYYVKLKIQDSFKHLVMAEARSSSLLSAIIEIIHRYVFF